VGEVKVEKGNEVGVQSDTRDEVEVECDN